MNDDKLQDGTPSVSPDDRREEENALLTPAPTADTAVSDEKESPIKEEALNAACGAAPEEERIAPSAEKDEEESGVAALPDSKKGNNSNNSEAAAQAPARKGNGKVRLRWHGVHPAVVMVPIVILLSLAVLLIIYFTTKQGVSEQKTTLFTNGLLPIAIETEIEGETVERWGYIDKDGEFAIEPTFYSAGSFASNGLAPVKTEDGWGYINKNGDIVIEAEYEDAAVFSKNGYAAVKRNGSWGYINKNGKLVINPQFDEAYAFTEEGLALVGIGGTYGYINRAGAYVIVPRFTSAGNFRPDGHAMVYEFGYWGMINSKGEYVWNPQFDSISEFSENGLALVCKDNKYGFIDKKGVYAIVPTYDYAESFASNGLALVQIDGKYGYINKAGELVLEGFYGALTFGSNGEAPVQTEENGTWHFINSKGEPTADKTAYKAAQSYAFGFALTVDADGKLSYVDEKKKNVITCPEDCINATSFFEDGFAILLRRAEGSEETYFSLINSKGEILVEKMVDFSML